MPIGVIEIRQVQAGNRRERIPYVQGTSRRIGQHSVRTRGWGSLGDLELAEGLDIEYEEQGHAEVADVRRYAPVPERVRRLLTAQGCTHLGLTLDKFTYRSSDQAFVKHALQHIVEVNNTQANAGDWFFQIRSRWSASMHPAAQVVRFTGTTSDPLTLHLSRGSALENAGICLHPLYGFVYLPGTGLKGLAHSFACEVWLPTRPDRQAAFNTVCQVFGHSSAPWLNDLARRHGVNPPDPKTSAAGAVVFHDAWPAAWPKLFVDILNNHHPKYYQGTEPPGDWENPIPVYFLAVEPGQKFEFAVAPRRSDVRPELLDLAVEWLIGGMTKLGVGAKTNAGYGTFTVDAPPPDHGAAPQNAETTWSAVRNRNLRAEFSTTLELVTPAFLAGGDQTEPASCVLRPATLRGQLRWWWRTLHAGFLDERTLRDLEGALWGTTTNGSVIRLVVRPVAVEPPRAFDKKQIQKWNQLPVPPNDKTTQGVWYHSFGMDDKKDGVTFRRNYLLPGSRWEITLTARSLRVGKSEVPAATALEQARMALGLLCAFGGVGGKSRKGFGCFADLAGFVPEQTVESARVFRQACGVDRPFESARAESPAWGQRLPFADVPADGWRNYWLLLDQVGDSAQRFAQQWKHNVEKRTLGLPRNIKPPLAGTFRPGGPVKSRHASPVHLHVGRTSGGKCVIRVTAFPARYLPDLAASQAFLAKLLAHLKTDLPARVQQHQKDGVKPAQEPAAPKVATPVAGPAVPKPNDWVDAVLLEERTKNGGWKARLKDGTLAGPISNTKDVPADATHGLELKLIVGSVSGSQIQFRYPTAADHAKKAQNPPPKKK